MEPELSRPWSGASFRRSELVLCEDPLGSPCVRIRFSRRFVKVRTVGLGEVVGMGTAVAVNVSKCDRREDTGF